MSLWNAAYNDGWWSNGSFVSPTGKIQLGANSGSTGAINIDANSYGETGLRIVNGTASFKIRVINNTNTVLTNDIGSGDLYFGVTSENKWRILYEAAGTASFVCVPAIARIIGGSSNGLAIRNSANTRDNFVISDPGSTATLTDGVRIAYISAANYGGEIGTSTASISGNNGATGGTWVIGDASHSTTVGPKTGLAYWDTSGPTLRSAVEVAAVAGFGLLVLMKSGGIVSIGNNSTGTADNLTLAGTAYGAGVASLRFNGLTDGAGVATGTLTNAPAATNPNFWLPVSIAGTIRYIPCW